MGELPDDCVALMVTSPPYHVGKEYDSDLGFDEYLELLRAVFKETYRVLEPGGRAVVNVANLGRRPYVSLADHVRDIMEDLKFFSRGEVIWVKAKGASGSCAWGSWLSASNPTFRDLHEYCLCFSKERWDRARKGVSTITREEFLAATLSVWEIPPESARRVSHPAPFPVALPRRFIELYTYLDDLVLDPFLGSGSTAVAATEAGRRYVGYDISEEYVNTARNRVLKAHEYQPPSDSQS
jgi:site-specific DNA-methyltransferase (adenine-specific)